MKAKRKATDVSLAEKRRMWDAAIDEVKSTGCTQRVACKKHGVPVGSFSVQARRRGLSMAAIPFAGATAAAVVARPENELVSELRGEVKVLKELVLALAGKSARRRRSR